MAFVVSYPSDMRAFAPDAQLAAIVHRWGSFYTRIAERMIDGSWRPEPVWGGIASGMVDIDAIDATLAPDIRAGLCTNRHAAIVAGTLAPFAAPLVDNAGTSRLARGALADADIKAMDWFVAGVVGNMPEGALTPDVIRPAAARFTPRAAASSPARGRTRTRPCRGCPSSRRRGGAAAHGIAPAGAGGDVPGQEVLVGRVHLDRMRRLAAVGEQRLPVARLGALGDPVAKRGVVRQLRAGQHAAAGH